MLVTDCECSAAAPCCNSLKAMCITKAKKVEVQKQGYVLWTIRQTVGSEIMITASRTRSISCICRHVPTGLTTIVAKMIQESIADCQKNTNIENSTLVFRH